MKILVLSDSHGNYAKMKQLFRENSYRAVIFLGDVLRDAEELSWISGAAPVYRVRGNCDMMSFDAYDEQLLELGGKRIFMAHGHTYGVKGGIGRFEAAAIQKDADIALYGHTHIQLYKKVGKMHVLNPGAFINGRYAEITIDKDILVELKDYE